MHATLSARLKKKQTQLLTSPNQPSIDINEQQLGLDKSVPRKMPQLNPVSCAHLEADVCSLQTWCCECWHSFLRVLAAAILTGGGERSTTADYETERRATDRAESVELGTRKRPAEPLKPSLVTSRTRHCNVAATPLFRR